VLVVKVSRFRPGQLEPEPVVVSANQEVAKKVVELIRESLSREVRDESVTTVSARSRTDD
jgi:hypothetical protein